MAKVDRKKGELAYDRGEGMRELAAEPRNSDGSDIDQCDQGNGQKLGRRSSRIGARPRSAIGLRGDEAIKIAAL